MDGLWTGVVTGLILLFVVTVFAAALLVLDRRERRAKQELIDEIKARGHFSVTRPGGEVVWHPGTWATPMGDATNEMKETNGHGEHAS